MGMAVCLTCTVIFSSTKAHSCPRVSKVMPTLKVSRYFLIRQLSSRMLTLSIDALAVRAIFWNIFVNGGKFAKLKLWENFALYGSEIIIWAKVNGSQNHDLLTFLIFRCCSQQRTQLTRASLVVTFRKISSFLQFNILFTAVMTPYTSKLASFPGLPRFSSSVCIQYNTRKRKSTGWSPPPYVIITSTSRPPDVSLTWWMRPGLPLFCALPLPLPCIILNTNQRTKTEAWEWGYKQAS